MQAATLFSPGDILDPRNHNTPNLSEFRIRLLAQGDSWFSIGALNLAKNSNLLHELEFTDTRCIINCARTGSTLRRMVDQMREPNFAHLLCTTTNHRPVRSSQQQTDRFNSLDQFRSSHHRFNHCWHDTPNHRPARRHERLPNTCHLRRAKRWHRQTNRLQWHARAFRPGRPELVRRSNGRQTLALRHDLERQT